MMRPAQLIVTGDLQLFSMLVQFVPVQKEPACWYKKLLEQSCLYRYKYQGVIISFLIDVSTEGLLSVSTVSNFFHCQHSVLFIVSTRFFPLKHPFKSLLLALGNIVYTLKRFYQLRIILGRVVKFLYRYKLYRYKNIKV